MGKIVWSDKDSVRIPKAAYKKLKAPGSKAVKLLAKALKEHRAQLEAKDAEIERLQAELVRWKKFAEETEEYDWEQPSV